MGLFSRNTDSDKATSTENDNNASYKEGFDAGKNGDTLSDMAQSTGLFNVLTNDPESYDNGYEEGAKQRGK